MEVYLARVSVRLSGPFRGQIVLPIEARWSSKGNPSSHFFRPLAAIRILTSTLKEVGCNVQQHEVSKQKYLDYITAGKRLDIPAHRIAFIVGVLGVLPSPDHSPAAYSLTPIVIAAIYKLGNGGEAEQRDVLIREIGPSA